MLPSALVSPALGVQLDQEVPAFLCCPTDFQEKDTLAFIFHHTVSTFVLSGHY